MITVHHLNNSRSQRVLWLLEELGLPYEIKRYQRDEVTMLAPPELRQVHPLGKSPVISDGQSVVAESGAIIEYLVERHGAGRLVPTTGTPEHLRYRYWLHFAEGTAMTTRASSRPTCSASSISWKPSSAAMPGSPAPSSAPPTSR